MRFSQLRGRLLLLAIGGFVLAACEEHRAPAARGAPEYLHPALSGDISAQRVLADCYEKAEGCIGIPSDPAMACAWRGVRLASESPELALSDSTAFATACTSRDPTASQRASIAFADLTVRIYRRDLPDLQRLVTVTAAQPELNPSIDQIRSRVNAELGRSGRRESLPPFHAARLLDDTILTWSSCSGAVCLEGVTPSFGGGVTSYRVTVRPSVGDAVAPGKLAASLAAAGLEWPAVGDHLAQDPPGWRQEGPVCWRISQGEAGAVTADAVLPPCRFTMSPRG